jgi:hypothetical protein
LIAAVLGVLVPERLPSSLIVRDSRSADLLTEQTASPLALVHAGAGGAPRIIRIQGKGASARLIEFFTAGNVTAIRVQRTPSSSSLTGEAAPDQTGEHWEPITTWPEE